MEPIVENKDLEDVVVDEDRNSKYKYIRKRRVTKTNERGDVMTLGNFCVECNIDMEPFMDHCPLCDICVEEYDHHCKFFGKCIGGGNKLYFDMASCLLFLQFCYLGGILFYNRDEV